MPARWLTELVGGPVYLKCENLQRTGSFKIRGAYNRIAQLNPQERARGVVAASAGNHAQAWHSPRRCSACAPRCSCQRATLPKIEATLAYGAQVEFTGNTADDALVAATACSQRTGAVLIHPFDHPDVIADQATVGLEIAEQHPEVRTVAVCTGGGGLLAGVSLGLGRLCPMCDWWASSPHAASHLPSLAAGHPVPLDTMSTMADGIAVARPGHARSGSSNGPVNS